MIVCVSVVGDLNNPLYIQSFTEADDALKLHHIVHCSLPLWTLSTKEVPTIPFEPGDRNSSNKGLLPNLKKNDREVQQETFCPMNNPKKSGPMLNETFLGLLYPTENYKVYGYLTNTKVKFILVTTDLDVRDADVRHFFRKFHAAFVDTVSNPFHVPGKKITSRTFAERVSGLVKSFGMGSSG